jgi:hypothetical protein
MELLVDKLLTWLLIDRRPSCSIKQGKRGVTVL